MRNRRAPAARLELPVKTPPITVSQMWHPRLDAEADHRWLRQLLLTVCRQRVQEPLSHRVTMSLNFALLKASDPADGKAPIA